ncbi:MAG: haloperoxidase, partial [Acidobacteria bacterium]|nr:haloperoxidase [Acidobacteriota bacterium]
MKTIRPAVTVVMLVLVLSPAKAANFSRPSAAYDWLDISLEATAREVDRHGARPTIISRTLAIALTAMYDAWAAYDDKAVGTRLGASLRRPAAERTVANKEKAIAYATYRALIDVYPDDKAWIDSQMRGKGFDPDDASVDPATPQGVGNLAAKAVCAYRHHDGANQFGDEVGSNGVPYSDYTYYAPVNTPEKVTDPNRWQPIPFVNPKGGFVTPGFLTPHWYRVKPFALDRSDQFRAPVPP